MTKPPWPMLWLYPIENWVGVSGILSTLAIFTALLIVPFRGEERHPLRRLPVVISAGAVVLFVIGMIAYALVTPVATHIE